MSDFMQDIPQKWRGYIGMFQAVTAWMLVAIFVLYHLAQGAGFIQDVRRLDHEKMVVVLNSLVDQAKANDESLRVVNTSIRGTTDAIQKMAEASLRQARKQCLELKTRDAQERCLEQ